MTDPSPQGDTPPKEDNVGHEQGLVIPKRRISMVWLIPAIAAVVSIWLMYTTFASKGPEITIAFNTAEGLEAGKTRIKFRDVMVGLVSDVRIDDNLSQVIVTAQMNKEIDGHLSGASRFWVVRPRFSAGGVSGFGTLVSGAYIELDPIDGPTQEHFIGLETPPIVRSGDAGKEFLLTASELGSINRSSPVFYRGIKVGEVLAYALADDNAGVEVRIFVNEPHSGLIRPGTRFWNASGVSARIDATGVNVSMESLASLIGGGVAFETSPAAMLADPSPNNATFELYKNFNLKEEERYQEKYSFISYFEESVRGLQKGAPVEFSGIRVGTVSDVGLELDPKTLAARVQVIFDMEPQRFRERKGASGVLGEENPYKLAEMLVLKGMRAQLQTGSLLTGQLVVDLRIHDNVTPKTLNYDGEYPEIPSVSSELDQLAASVNSILQEVASLPLKELVQDMRNTVQALGGIARSPKINRALTSLDQTLVGVNRIVDKVGQDVGPLVSSLRKTSDAATDAIKQAQTTLGSANDLVSKDSVVRHNLNNLLKELAEASRSIRFLADYLEKHPEAFIQGKGGTNP